MADEFLAFPGRLLRPARAQFFCVDDVDASGSGVDGRVVLTDGTVRRRLRLRETTR